MATPEYGSMIFVGLVTAQTYAKDIYVSDVANANVQWDSGAGASASSGDHWIAPEPVSLVDFVMITGTADTEKLMMTANGIPTGDVLRYSQHLDSLANRARLNIRFNRGTKISAYQIAD